MAGTILHSTILHSTFRLLLLLTSAVLAAVGSENVEASLETLSQGFATTPRSTDNAGIVNATRNVETGIPTSVLSGTKEKNEKVSWIETMEDVDDEEESDDDEVDENDPVDEYEEELRGIAESHEAMSRNERRNEVSSSTSEVSLVSENRSFGDRLGVTKRNFDSREKSDENSSDESSVSNEALPTDEDEEVAELLRYKQKIAWLRKEDVVGGTARPRLKVKRVPTVKKELSTQKEILALNVTDVLPKKLDASVEIVNRLDEETKQETRYAVPVTPREPNRYELVRGDLGRGEEYADVDRPADLLRKLDKRQPSELDALRSYFLGGNTPEQEQQRKLQELGIEEGVLAESFMELLTRIAEDPRRWERVRRLLKDVEGDIQLSKTSLLDSRKRAYVSSDSSLEVSLTDSTTGSPIERSTTKKPKKKKKKKKKKKSRDRSEGTTSTSRPTTLTTTASTSFEPPLLTTTESPGPTTPAQWRLVAERLFGSPWSDDRQEAASSLAKVLYAATAEQRGGNTVKDRPSTIDDKQRESLKALNDERQALMLQSAREYSQPRRLHYGKVNTHEKGSPSSSNDDTEHHYSDNGSPSGSMDYEIPERSYQQRPIAVNRYDRYGQYGGQRSRDYVMSPVNRDPDEYDEIFRYPDGTTNHRPFARTQQFRPLGREYASTKTWQDSRYDYGRPWRDKSRTNFDRTPAAGGHWPWRQSQGDYKAWIPRYQPWSRERSNWQRFGNDEDEDEDPMDEYEDNESAVSTRNWQRNSQQQQQQQQSWRNYPLDSVWPVDGNVDVPSWPVPDRPKSPTREILPGSLEKSKNLSELVMKESPVKTVTKDKPVLPKITMKTWNSLTSDPATWPFKLTGAKPWPKDKNGKSYNPNAELVRKLGLDKQDRLLSSNKENGKGIVEQGTPSRYSKMVKSMEKVTSKNEKGPTANTAKSSISWPVKLSAVNEWSTSRENERLPQRDEARNVWRAKVGSDRKMWSGKSQVSPKISSVGAWVMPADQSTWRPYELKETAYGQLSEVPRGGWPDSRNNNPEENGGGSWSSPKKEVSSATWPHKINNDWNVENSVYSAGKPAPTSHSSTWPSKWRQFAYHKVTAAPITKPGSTNLSEGSGRPRNSYIAVSAVSAPKYPNNEWRKNDIEESQVDRSPNGHGARLDQDDPSSQLRKVGGATKEQWGKQAGTANGKGNDYRERNANDPLEHQLEELRQVPHWNHDQLREQKRSNVSGVSPMTVVSTQTSYISTNSSRTGSEAAKRLEGSAAAATQVEREKDVTK